MGEFNLFCYLLHFCNSAAAIQFNHKLNTLSPESLTKLDQILADLTKQEETDEYISFDTYLIFVEDVVGGEHFRNVEKFQIGHFGGKIVHFVNFMWRT